MPNINPSHYKNFNLRGESYKLGMLLLINYLTQHEWKQATIFSARLILISNKVDALYKNYVNNFKNETITSFEAAKNSLESLLSAFIEILVVHTKLKDPSRALFEAERYAVWLKGRQCFETRFLLSMKEDPGLKGWVVLNEAPVYDQELLRADYSNKDSFCFKSLAPWQRNFIRDNQNVLSGSAIPAALRNIPGLANVSFHNCKFNGKSVLAYFRHATQVPIDFLKKKGTQNEQFRITCLNIASQIRQSIEKREAQKAFKLPGEIIILTQSLLSPGKAAYLKATLISDASDNDTTIYKLKEKAVRFFQNALTNPDELIQDEQIKLLFFTAEERKQKQLHYKDFLKKWGLVAKENKAYQYKQHKPLKITLLSTNHPLNVLRHLEAYPLQDKCNELNTALLLGVIARYLAHLRLTYTDLKKNSQWQPKGISQILEVWARSVLNAQLNDLIERLTVCEREKKSANHIPFITKCIGNLLTVDIKVFLDKNTILLLDALQTLLSMPNGQGVLTADARHKPQLRSVAEIVLVNCLSGIVWLACKSGKDRTGGASAAADAAAIYYQQKKKFPRYQDNKSDRADYLKLLKELLNSGHQQRIALENAPGAAGLIKAIYFLPKDLKLDKNTTLCETQLASLNKPNAKNISDKKLFYPNVLSDDLQDIKDKTFRLTMDKNSTLADWKKNWTHYFINGKNVAALRKHKVFENENDLSTFIEAHLLKKISEATLKKYYNALILYAFHQEGFPHAFSTLSLQAMNERYQQKATLDQSMIQVNFSWLEKNGSIQIEEVGHYCYKRKKNLNLEDAPLIEKEDCYFQTYSCILLKLREIKGRGYRLEVKIQNASAECLDEGIKSIFQKELNLLEVFIAFIQSLLRAIKRYFDEAFKSFSVLDEKWLIKANSIFFQQPEHVMRKTSTEKSNESAPCQINPQFFTSLNNKGT